MDNGELSGYTLPPVPDEELADLDWTRLADRIKRRREHFGISQAQLAQAAGVSVGTIQNLEGGRVPGTWPRRLSPVIRALGWDAGSGLAIVSGGEPRPRSAASDPQSDLVFILSNIAKAGPWTMRALRAVLEADIKSDKDDE